jgi:hypothetical protein
MACRADLAFVLEYLTTDLTLLDGVFRGEGKMKRADGQVTDLREKGVDMAVPWSTWSAEVETGDDDKQRRRRDSRGEVEWDGVDQEVRWSTTGGSRWEVKCSVAGAGGVQRHRR